MQMPKRKRYQKDTAPADDIVTLIHLVRQNPALYNYKLQPNQRRRSDILNGWAQVASQIGNKYTVEECRRKWKNLRDTYHQYRLRKPKIGDTLSKWRYAKELEFLSNIYQPKLKSNRTLHMSDEVKHEILLHSVQNAGASDDDKNHLVHHGGITLVNDDAETFILAAYEESVNCDVSGMDHDPHDDPNMGHMELTHHHGGNEIVKNEESSLDDNGATGAEVDYEEVCLYEEANVPPNDCETIISTGGGVIARRLSPDTKDFQYIDAHDFCIESINANTQLHHHGGGGDGGVCSGSDGSPNVVHTSSSGCNPLDPSKFKNITVIPGIGGGNGGTASMVVSSASGSTMSVTDAKIAGLTTGQNPQSSSGSMLHTQTIAMIPSAQGRDELDLFFDFLKKKMQNFNKEDITGIQVEFLNCVLRREAENSPKKIIK